MKKIFLTTTLIFLITGIFSCEPALKVTSDYDKNVNFQRYKTFSMYEVEKMSDAISQFNKDRIVNSIRNEMKNKGYTENDSNPDLFINPVAILADKVAVSASTNYYGFGGIYRPYGWGAGTIATNYNVQHYNWWLFDYRSD